MGEGSSVGVINFRHLRDGEGQAVGNGADVVDFIETEGAIFPGFQVFVDHLIAAEVPTSNLVQDQVLRARKQLSQVDLILSYQVF